ncbi:phytanoyl-CoA dioxygenase family protein [Flavobacterium sp. DG1-102-2]|uniref:phytanoyl-CoA dioxygenase family protein n=1 Tax=Flavobacterium sp. DG1-102-2 TaxID=3081663 RepID=UPI0029494199|nr:phytanoyl-CoA dioxygenase family protein [Flavobacterium sp. DG1-102-2]MDV6167282.1 phytanoyl-CoA dioxygenase family protein [Flavobacterium sp. DG1-102-2]
MTFTEAGFQLKKNGFTILENIYTKEETEQIIKIINEADTTADTFRKSSNLFAIRQFLKEVPESISYIMNYNLITMVRQLFGNEYFAVKSIYFDKPGESNWFVAYHQDLTVSVDKKQETEGFGPWTVKQNQFAVQPTLDVLENIFTIRIHLDETDENNGALKVIPGSHNKQIYRPETIDWSKESEVNCNVSQGGIMIMKPLLLHSSGKTTNNARRRVIHIEFSNKSLPNDLQWAEYINVLNTESHA